MTEPRIRSNRPPLQFGAKLEYALERYRVRCRKLTNEELAAQIGTYPGKISKWTGNPTGSSHPTPAMLYRICQALRVPLRFFCDDSVRTFDDLTPEELAWIDAESAEDLDLSGSAAASPGPDPGPKPSAPPKVIDVTARPAPSPVQLSKQDQFFLQLIDKIGRDESEAILLERYLAKITPRAKGTEIEQAKPLGGPAVQSVKREKPDRLVKPLGN